MASFHFVASHLLTSSHISCQKPSCPKISEPSRRDFNSNRLYVSCSSLTTQEITQPQRRSANYQPTMWSYDFLQSLQNQNANEICEDKARKLEDEIRVMIQNEDGAWDVIELIDDVQRLGLTHRFEEEIRTTLQKYFGRINNVKPEMCLHATAFSFRLLRQHGYKVSQDVFKRFMDDSGNLKTCHHDDIHGMLSLYEASYYSYEEEDILDKAKFQTIIHLKNIQRNADSVTAEQINHALDLPLHHRMLLSDARWYIEAYSKRKDVNSKLLQLAKTNFNMVQSIHQKDLQDMSRWWSDLGLAHKLSFSRDRLMECFFWTVGMVCEPQFSSCRKGLTKVTSLITTIDDVYDVYGTLEELELFTDAVERWDLTAITDLPDYMKLCFLALYNTINEMAYDTLKEHGEDAIPYLTKAWGDICKTFLQEAKWSHNKSTPTFEEYYENGWRSVSGTVILVHAYFLLGCGISKEKLDSLMTYHQLLHWPSVIFRLCNDLGTSSDELARGESINSISCYMNESGVSEKQARQEMKTLIEKAWKKLNEEHVVNKNTFAEPFVRTCINLARISEFTYQHGDSHGAPDATAQNRILSLIIEPIS